MTPEVLLCLLMSCRSRPFLPLQEENQCVWVVFLTTKPKWCADRRMAKAPCRDHMPCGATWTVEESETYLMQDSPSGVCVAKLMLVEMKKGVTYF